MMLRVVDTNVLVVANGRDIHADEGCQLACIETLEEIETGGVIVLDQLGFILDEYAKHCQRAGEPGVGDAFFKYAFDNQYIQSKCILIGIRKLPGDPGNFQEFPNKPALKSFDPSDRVFVAVAIACRGNPLICNATDSDWAEFESALQKEGIIVKQVCPKYARKETAHS